MGTEPERFVDEDQTVPLHPQAGLLDPGGIDKPGTCICGGVLPPQRGWHMAGRDWAHVRCMGCRWLYVDEGEYIAIYEDHPEPCCDREERDANGRTADQEIS